LPTHSAKKFDGFAVCTEKHERIQEAMDGPFAAHFVFATLNTTSGLSGAAHAHKG
jgi:hypothetical protein